MPSNKAIPQLPTVAAVHPADLLPIVSGGITSQATVQQVITGVGGTVQSVALTVPAEFSVAGSPITTTGTLAVSKATQSANTVWAGPSSGGAVAPAFRALVSSDVRAVKGTTTNDNAAAGDVGEYISSDIPIGSAVSLSTGVAKTITSISLTAGDWDVWVNGYVVGNVATNVQYYGISVSLTNNNIDVSDGRLSVNPGFSTTLFVFYTQPSINTGPVRLSLAGTTTVYYTAQSGFSINTLSMFGIIQARRVR